MSLKMALTNNHTVSQNQIQTDQVAEQGQEKRERRRPLTGLSLPHGADRNQLKRSASQGLALGESPSMLRNELSLADFSQLLT